MLSCPAWTWEFDLGSKKWNERASYLQPRWRSISGISAFGKWLAGDMLGNRILYVDEHAYDELGQPLLMQLDSGPVSKFSSRTKIAVANFLFETGVGNALGPEPQATDPTVGISWSNDGGFVYGHEIIRKLGRQSLSLDIRVLRTGQTSAIGRRWRLKVSGPVYVGFLGGSQNTEMTR